MCTVVISRRPGAPWPLAIAANRDEMLDRPWDAPAPHWPGRPDIVGGRDRLAGGTWMAMRGGMIAAVLNRPGSLGPACGFRSRGEMPLLALGHETAEAAAAALGTEDGGAWRPFNLVIADSRTAWLLVGDGPGPVTRATLPDGVTMITAIGRDEGATPRARRYLPRFRDAPHPSPDHADTWAHLLGSTAAEEGAGRRGGLTVLPDRGYGTVASSLVFLPSGEAAPVWLFAGGAGARSRFKPVAFVARTEAC